MAVRVHHVRGSRKMGRLAQALAISLVALAAWPTMAGASGSGHALLVDTRQHGLAALYARWPAIAADYVTAMMRYRTAAEIERLPSQLYPFVMFDRPPLGGPWTWTAANGSHARRLQNGRLHLSLTGHLGNWFAEIDCLDAGWPVFACSDGIERVAAAPAPQLLVVDGLEFSRVLPAGKLLR